MAKLEADDVHQRFRKIAGRKVLFDKDDFLWHQKDWTEGVAEALASKDCAWKIAAVAFTGHKSLLGPTGIGGLTGHPELEVQTTRFEGTGVDSKRLIHTQTFPHRLEAGTLNLMGIIDLSAGP